MVIGKRKWWEAFNSSKGAELLNQCQELLMEERPKEESLYEQKRLSEPVQFPEDRSLFWDNYRRFGFEYVIGDNNGKLWK